MCSEEIFLEPVLSDQVDSLLLAPDRQTIASRGRDRIMIWDMQGRCQACLEEFPGAQLSLSGISAAAFSTCGRFIAGGGDTGRITVWEITNRVTTDSYSNDKRFQGGTISSEHRFHLCLTPIKLFKFTQGNLPYLHGQRVQALTSSPTMTWLESAAADRKIIIWDTGRECPLWCMESLELETVSVVSLTFPTTTTLFLGCALAGASPLSRTVYRKKWQLDNRETNGNWELVDKDIQETSEANVPKLLQMGLTGTPLKNNETSTTIPYPCHYASRREGRGSLLLARERPDSAPLTFFKHTRPITTLLQGNSQIMVFGDTEDRVSFIVGHNTQTEDKDMIQLWVQFCREPWMTTLHLPRMSTISSLYNRIYDILQISTMAQSVNFLSFKSRTLFKSEDALASHGIGADSTVQLNCRLLGGGGNHKRNKDDRIPTHKPTKISPVTTSFRTLHLIQQQDRAKREEEEDKEAGVESGMGLSEERRKRSANEAAKPKLQTREGNQREALALHNLEASALLVEIQQANEDLTKLPEDTNVSKIRHLVQQRVASIELVELVSRTWLQQKRGCDNNSEHGREVVPRFQSQCEGHHRHAGHHYRGQG
jgi:hypothetical protein